MMTPMLPVMVSWLATIQRHGDGNVITAGRREAAHRANHRLAGLPSSKFFDGPVDFIRRHHFAAGRIHFQNDGLDVGILFRACPVAP